MLKVTSNALRQQVVNREGERKCNESFRIYELKFIWNSPEAGKGN